MTISFQVKGDQVCASGQMALSDPLRTINPLRSRFASGVGPLNVRSEKN
ncbi:hypothetical protein P3T16_006787 [Paraburkholderia sp. GAS42]